MIAVLVEVLTAPFILTLIGIAAGTIVVTAVAERIHRRRTR